ncbi:MAG: hypothetical protein ACLQBX_15385 [Candidatus Limnocylindrales bacterium]
MHQAPDPDDWLNLPEPGWWSAVALLGVVSALATAVSAASAGRRRLASSLLLFVRRRP